MGKRLNCYKCRYFFVTWERNYPYGCRYFGFKSRYFPAAEVLRSSEIPCLYFKDKFRKKQGESEND